MAQEFDRINNPSKIPLKLYNTLSHQKEILDPLQPGHVTMYTCGPTVYNYAHIGNFRTYVFEDLLRRAIQFFGYKITQAMNLTDVDDKTIKGAIAQNTTLDAFTQVYKDAFFHDLKTLNIQPVEYYPAATEYIDEMIRIIEGLVDKGVAYKGNDGSIYYAIKKFPHYGCLSHLHLDELQAGASERVAADEYDKDNVSDFVLWIAYDAIRDGKIFWESPFGAGRPGWHLECSAMAMKLLGPTIDIHVGGIDNMFPHHENEIAQSEAYSGQLFSKMWMHSEHLLVDNKKMSKSLGNFFTLRDLLQRGYTGAEVRYMLLQVHYKTQLNFTFTGLDSVRETLARLNNFIQRLLEIEKDSPIVNQDIDLIIDKTHNSFTLALADDLNISLGLAAIFDLIREVNVLCDAQKIGHQDAEKVIKLMKQFDTILGVLSFEKQTTAIPQELQEALEKRIQARKDKNWALADQMRDYIISNGYFIEDTPNGMRLKKNA